jgi:hypothetical protein
MNSSKVCSLDVWLLTFLSALLVLSFGTEAASTTQQWVRWPVTISLGSVAISLVSLEIAARRLPVPAEMKGARRAALYIAAFIIGIVLNYAITPAAVGSPGFRIGILLIFGLPFFVWLAGHVWQHHQATARVVVAICTLARSERSTWPRLCFLRCDSARSGRTDESIDR